MKKFLKILALLLALGIAFLAGWRIMPKIWPSIKPTVVSVLNIPTPTPVITPTPAPTLEPYVPKANANPGEPFAETDSLVLYFYKDYCPHCRNLEPLTANLPDEVILPDGSRSAVKLICINKNTDDGLAFIQEYYDAHAIAEDRQFVPAMIIGEQYLFTADEILAGLYPALLNGEGLDTPRY